MCRGLRAAAMVGKAHAGLRARTRHTAKAVPSPAICANRVNAAVIRAHAGPARVIGRVVHVGTGLIQVWVWRYRGHIAKTG
jgi:hypothetical protein